MSMKYSSGSHWTLYMHISHTFKLTYLHTHTHTHDLLKKWGVNWSEVKWSEVKWSEGHVKISVQYLCSNNIRNQVQYFLPPVLLFLCVLLLTVVGLLCIGLLFLSVFLILHVYCFTVCVLLSYILQLPDWWLEVSIRKVLRPATSAQVFLGFSVSKSECWDGSQHSKFLLHASHVALPT
jgi:hypothetical protein